MVNGGIKLPQRQIGQRMGTHEKNKIQHWAKLNHVHYCAIYFKAKDIQNFIRHYLFLRMDFANEFHCLGTLRADITALTQWDAKAITNAIGKLKQLGEIEQIASNAHRFNPVIANRFGYFSKKKYEGKQPDYDGDPALKYMTDALHKIIHTRTSPSIRDEYEKMRAAEQDEADEMVALLKIESLEQTVKEQNETLKTLEGLIRELLTKVDPDTQVIIKRHLELVKD